MKTYFVIASINGGFWDSRECSFRGILFATKYKSNNCNEILKDMELASKGTYCYIQQIYTE